MHRAPMSCCPSLPHSLPVSCVACMLGGARWTMDMSNTASRLPAHPFTRTYAGHCAVPANGASLFTVYPSSCIFVSSHVQTKECLVMNPGHWHASAWSLRWSNSSPQLPHFHAIGCTMVAPMQNQCTACHAASPMSWRAAMDDTGASHGPV
jgi:hypothetical protein